MSVPVPEDQVLKALVQRAQAGDQVALEELLGRIRSWVLARCRVFLPCHEDAEEAAQDALLTVATKLGQLSARGSFRGWVVVVCSNSAAAPAVACDGRSADRSDTLLPETADPRTTSVIAGTRLDLLDVLEALEVSSPAVVEPFVLRDLGGLAYDDIAALTGVPLSAVKDRIHRARLQLRKTLPH